MTHSPLQGILTFIKNAENLKNTLRFSFTSGGRQESTAEHSWRLCLLVMTCSHLYPELNQTKLLQLAVIHDLAEAICGDTPATCQSPNDNKTKLERDAMAAITSPLPDTIAKYFCSLWEEYEQGTSKEAACVKALDKLETLIQHNQGMNQPNFDYGFNLTYGNALMGDDAVLVALRHLIDEETKDNINATLSATHS